MHENSRHQTFDFTIPIVFLILYLHVQVQKYELINIVNIRNLILKKKHPSVKFPF